MFDLVVICSTDCKLAPVSARVELSSAGSVVERQNWTAAMLAKIRRISYRVEPKTPIESPTRVFTLPEAFDLRFYFRCPQALAVDSANLQIIVEDTKGLRAEQKFSVPVRYYQQKTSLIVPFRGNGIIGQDWITSGGHGGIWNAFAVDLDGLDQNDGELSDANDNAADAGWGRQILRPLQDQLSTLAMMYQLTRTQERNPVKTGIARYMIR